MTVVLEGFPHNTLRANAQMLFEALFSEALSEPALLFTRVRLGAREGFVGCVQFLQVTFTQGFDLVLFRDGMPADGYWKIQERCSSCGGGIRTAVRSKSSELAVECGGCGLLIGSVAAVMQDTLRTDNHCMLQPDEAVQRKLAHRMTDFGVEPLEAVLVAADFMTLLERFLLVADNVQAWDSASISDR